MPRNKRDQSAFTLIEILVVVVIISIALALIAPNLFPDERGKATTESEQIFHALELARDEAVFSGRPIAAEFHEGELWFLERDINDSTIWVYSSRETLKKIMMPKDLHTLSLDGAKFSEATTDNRSARIIFLPAGIGIPFTITLAFNKSQHIISGDPLGNLAIKHISE